MGEGDGDVGEDGGDVGVDRGDDDGPQRRSGATGSKGREPPFFFFFLALLPRWEKGFPLWSLAPMEWEGQEPLRDWIYLSVSMFSDSTPSPFL